MRFAFRLGVLTAAFAVSLQAQHGGGGHAGSGFHSSGSGFHSSGSGLHSSSSFSMPLTSGFSTANRSPYVYSRPSNSRFGRGYTPYRRSYVPLIAGSYFDPFYDSSFDYAPGPYGGYGPDPAEQQQFGPEMPQYNAPPPYSPDGYYPMAPAPYPYAPGYSAAAPSSDPAPAAAPVTVVLRSGQKIEVQNYAVMGDSFWDFSRQPARRIPLSSVDIAASAKATEAGGGQFPAI
jgi:hypothetical protein